MSAVFVWGLALLMAALVFMGCPTDTEPDPEIEPVSLTNWQAVVNSAFSGEVGFITYGNGKFVAGGRNNSAAYSPDGVTWTTLNGQAWLSESEISRPKYLNEKFWAGGNDNKLASSSDGVTWSAITTTGLTSFDFYDIAYGAGKYVAVSSGGKMAYSSDGTAWTATDQTEIFKRDDNTAVNINSIVFAAGKFVAVGQSGTSAYSADGITWTNTGTGTTGTHVIFGNTSSGSNGIKMAAYGNGKFVIAGNGKVATSTDGAAWEKIDLSTFIEGESVGWLNCIIFADGRFVAGGANGRAIYSTDGKNWTRITQTEPIFGSQYINGLAFGGGKFVAVGGGDAKIAYTTSN
jgi:hypothetical protein